MHEHGDAVGQGHRLDLVVSDVHGGDAVLQDVRAAVELSCFPGRGGDGDRPSPSLRPGGAPGRVAPGQAALGHLGADSGRRAEGGDAGAARAQAFGEGALRSQFPLQLPAEVLAGELLVLADVGAGDPGDAAGGEQDAQATAVDAAVVGDDLQALRALRVQGADEDFRYAAQAGAANGE